VSLRTTGPQLRQEVVPMIEVKQTYWTELSEVAGVLAANLIKILESPGTLYGDVVNGGQFYGIGFMIVVDTKSKIRDDPARLEQVDSYLAKNLLVNLAAEFPIFRKILDWRNVNKDEITPDIVQILQMVSHRRTFLEKCEVSQSWYCNPSRDDTDEALKAFYSLYSEGSSTYNFYQCYLSKSIPPLKLLSSTAEIQDFVDHRCGKKGISEGGRNAYFRSIRAFFNWAFSPASGKGLIPSENPIIWVKPPKVNAKIMPAQDEKSMARLLSFVHSTQDRAILSTLIDSGGRLAEVSKIDVEDILWEKRAVKAISKGGEEVFMPLSKASEILIKAWLEEAHITKGKVWGLSKAGIVSMLRRLEKVSGVKCNAHTFRRGFASILRRNGVDTLDIMKLGHWKSISMVKRYTESVDFEDSQKHYIAPTEQIKDATHIFQKKGRRTKK
jgi:site-specific recombinase XerD